MRDRTARSRAITTPLRLFLRTEAGSAGVLVAAIAVALLWANVADSSYEAFWRTELAGTSASWHRENGNRIAEAVTVRTPDLDDVFGA